MVKQTNNPKKEHVHDKTLHECIKIKNEQKKDKGDKGRVLIQGLHPSNCTDEVGCCAKSQFTRS